ncbi:hypothetical protein BaRGS_00021272, partial [Batillaria attramentaria]
MFARETSNVRKTYSRGPADPAACKMFMRERSNVRRASRTSLDPIEIYTRERSNLRRPTLERTKSKQGKRPSLKGKTAGKNAQKTSRPEASEIQKREEDTASSQQVPMIELEKTPRPGIEDTPRQDTDRALLAATENTPWQDTDRALLSGTENTPRQDRALLAATENTPWQDTDRALLSGTENTPRQDRALLAATENTPWQDTDRALLSGTENTPRQDRALLAGTENTPRQDTDRALLAATENTPWQDTDRALLAGTENTPRVDETPRPGTVNTPQNDPGTHRPGTESTFRQNMDNTPRPETINIPRQNAHKTPRPKTKQTPRLERGRSFTGKSSRAETEGETPRPGTQNTPRKTARKNPRPGTEQTARLQRENSFRGDIGGASRMSSRPATEQTSRRHVIGASRPGTEQTPRPDKRPASRQDTDRSSRQGGRISRKEATPRPNTKKAPRQDKISQQRAVSQQDEKTGQDAGPSSQWPEANSDAENEMAEREPGDGTSVHESYLPSRRSHTRGMSRILTDEDVSEQVDEDITSPREDVITADFTPVTSAMNEDSSRPMIKANVVHEGGIYRAGCEENTETIGRDIKEVQTDKDYTPVALSSETAGEARLQQSTLQDDRKSDTHEDSSTSDHALTRTAITHTQGISSTGNMHHKNYHGDGMKHQAETSYDTTYAKEEMARGRSYARNTDYQEERVEAISASIPQISYEAGEEIIHRPIDVDHTGDVQTTSEETNSPSLKDSKGDIQRKLYLRIETSTGVATPPFERVGKNDKQERADSRVNNSLQREERREESARVVGRGCGGEKTDDVLGRPPTVT